MIKENAIKAVPPVELECGIKVNKYLTYAQIQQIINSTIQFETWSEREMNMDMLILYHATNLTKEQIEETGHEAFVTSGIMEEVRNIVDVHKIYEALSYTESTAKAVTKIAKELPKLLDDYLSPVIGNASKKR